jgi:chemotaxis signal transduction protein
VDSVEDVMRIPRQSISPVPKTLAMDMNSSFLTDICKLKDNLVMILDIDKLIPQEITALSPPKEAAA